jgi:hypothetical protein
MISKTNEQIYTMHYILEQNNHPGYRMYMPTYQSYYKSHITCYKDVEYRDIDKRDHGWTDVCIKSPVDGSYKYYKFIEVGEPVYKGWLKKWNKISDNRHFLVIYTNEPCIADRKYAIYSFENVSKNINKYFGREDKEKHYIDNFYAKECIKIQFSPITSTRRIKDLQQCFDYAVDNTWEYLTHKSAGYKYIYKDWEYSSLNDLYQNTIYGIKYGKFDSFRKAFQRGKITDVSKAPVSYLDDVESNKKAKEVSLLRKAPQPTNVVYSESREQELSGCPKAKSSLPVLDMKQKESVNHKSKEQETKPENEPKSSSMWRDESVGTKSKSMWRDESVDAFDYLRALIEEENKNKVVTPVEVYKCKRA